MISRSRMAGLVAILLLAAPSCGHSRVTPGAQDEIVIGALYNRSGNQATLDEASAQGAELAVERANASGGALGRQIRLDLRDGRADIGKLAEEGVRMAGDPAIGVVLGLSESDMVLAPAPAITDAKKLFIVSGATSPLLPKRLPSMLFLACFGDNTQAAAAAEFAWERLSVRQAVVLFDESMEYTRGLASYFSARFSAAGGQVVKRLLFKSTDLSLDSQIAEMRSLTTSPGLVYLAAGPLEAPKIIERLREAGFDQPILGGDTFVAEDLIEEAGDASDHVLYTTHVRLDPATSDLATQDFLTAYEKRFGERPPNAFAALGYDSVGLVVWAMGNANSTDPKAIARFLESGAVYNGVTGSIRYGKGQHIPYKTVSIVQIAKGRAFLATTWTPSRVPEP